MAKKHPAVLRVAPVRETGLHGAHAHQARTKVPPNADPARLRLNQTLHGSGDIKSDVLGIFNQHKLADKRGVPFAEMILTAHGDYFDRICPNWKKGERTEAFQNWIDLSLSFLKEQYGEGLASAELHMDEESPHIHAMVVPIATYTKRYRRGEKEVTRIKYSHYFSDTAQLISKARKENNPELTKLGRLQTAYAKAVEPVGLIRGRKGSTATHTSTREWRTQLSQKSITPKQRPLQKVPDETTLELLTKKATGKASRKDRIVADNNAERLRYRKAMSRYIKQAQSKAKRYDALQHENNSLKAELRNKEKVIMKKDNDIREINETLSLHKEQIAHLRKAPLEQVAKLLNYTGSIYVGKSQQPKWRGAIDMVMEVAGLEYRQAVAWLYHEIGESKATLVAQQQFFADGDRFIKEIREKKDPRPLTKQEYAIQKELEKQLSALDAPKYRITMMHPEPGRTYNVGKSEHKKEGKDGERFYSKDEVIALVPKLNNENWRREYNVFITPWDKDNHYILLDDLDRNSLEDVKKLSVNPCVVQQSSDFSIQAVVKVPVSEAGKAEANEWFKEMNRTFGDSNISGLIHPFRAAGFRNMKDKHLDEKTQRRPIVKLLTHVGGACSTSVRLIREYAQKLTALRSELVSGRDASHPFQTKDAPPGANTELLESIAILDQLDEQARGFYAKLSAKYGDSMDGSRADWMLSQKLLQQGCTPAAVGECIRRHSPYLEDRKDPTRVDYYISLTVKKAVADMHRKSEAIPSAESSVSRINEESLPPVFRP